MTDEIILSAMNQSAQDKQLALGKVNDKLR